MDGPNHLKSVDDDQHGAGVFHREVFDLFLQPLSDRGAPRTEVDAVRRVLRDLEQPVLNAEDGVLQTEIEGGALPGGHVPDWFSLGYGHCQPEGQPGLPHLRGARQDMQPLGEQGVHHKIRWMQGLAHQRCPVDRIEFHVANASLSDPLSVGFIPRLC